MEITDELRELILVGASALELRRKAIERGDDHAPPQRAAQGHGRRHDDRGSRAGDGEVRSSGSADVRLTTSHHEASGMTENGDTCRNC